MTEDEIMIFDLIIIGGGPAGVAAGVYASRKKIKSLLITKDWGGQSKVSPEIQNFIGIKKISGIDLAKKLEEHVKFYADAVLEFDEDSLVKKVFEVNSDEQRTLFGVETDKGKRYLTKTVLVASGASRRKLGVPGAEKFEGRGVVYCASCDAPLFQGRKVVVVGGGNAGFEAAHQLLAYAQKIYILEYTDSFKADVTTQEEVLKQEKVVPIKMAQVLEIKGKDFVESLVYLDRKKDEKKEIEIEGVFVEIGSVPNCKFVEDLVEINEFKEIIVNHKNGRTSKEGIWAAGDVTDQPYKQNNISMGDGIKALEDIYLYLQKRK